MPHPTHPIPASSAGRGLDFDRSPFLVIWETTQACDLACVHCRAQAQPHALPGELTPAEGIDLIDQVAALGAPILVLSGGDPLKRWDLLPLIRHGKSKGLRMGTIPAATPLLTRDVVRSLKDAGLDQMAQSLDAPTAETHDAFRRVPGAFAKTMEAAAWAHEFGLPLQINTVIGRHNFPRLDDMIKLVKSLDVVFWEVFFLVPVGRGQEVTDITAHEYEEAFAKIDAVTRAERFVVKVTEAPHFRRFYIQQQLKEEGRSLGDIVSEGIVLPEKLRRRAGPSGTIGQAPQGVNAGKGFVFVSYDGKIFPSGFLPVAAGNVKTGGLAKTYRESPIFRDLRDPSKLKGRCGACEFRGVCGGSRSRAWALTGDYLAEDVSCAYQPGA